MAKTMRHSARRRRDTAFIAMEPLTLPLVSEPLCEMEIQTEPARVVAFAGGRKAVAMIGSGTVSGRITGRVLPGGADWFVIDPNGVGHVDVRLMIEVDGGEFIDVAYDGKLVMPRGGWRRLSSGEDLPPDEVYFRTALRFVAADGDYGWLNSILAVGVGAMGPGWVRYSVHELR
jgi:hypothetical protein